jgi:hypothetical protein
VLQKKKKEVTAATLPSPSFFVFLAALCFSLQRYEEGDGSNTIAFFVFYCVALL